MDYSKKAEPIYTILAYEADQLQKPVRLLHTNPKTGIEVWEQNPLSVVPNILALASKLVHGDLVCLSGPYEKRFQLDLTPYDRPTPLTGGTTMISRGTQAQKDTPSNAKHVH
ncbi:MAG: hypothetical protein AABY13_00900, partial [Nanoarchaeota archaeon]